MVCLVSVTEKDVFRDLLKDFYDGVETCSVDPRTHCQVF